jgi:hypothetical protein
MTRSIALALVSCLVAGAAVGCGVKDRTEGRIELADASITIEQPDGVKHQLTVAASGEVRWDGKPLVTIGKRGTLKVGAKIVARIDKYGAVTIGGQPTNIAVTRDGAFIMDETPELTITTTGLIDGPLIDSIDHPAVVLEGSKLTYAGPPAARQAVLLGFAAVVTPALVPRLDP